MPVLARVLRVEGACEAYGQAGGLREADGGEVRKGAEKRLAGAAEKARWRTESKAAAVRDEMRESPGKLARKFPEFEPETR